MKRLTVVTIGAALFLLLGVLGMGTAVAAPNAQPFFPDPQESAAQAVAWLIAAHQNEDGGYSSFSGGAGLAPSDVGGTVDALLAIASAGVSPDDSLAYLNENIADVVAYASGDGASAGKLVWALAAAGQDPRNFGGEDFVAALNGHLQADGSYNAPHPFGQSLAMYALAFVGEPVPAEAIAWLIDLQSAEEGLDGSWDDGFGTLGNADATAMAVMALSAAGVPADDDSLSRAVDFLTAVQLETGGWEYGPGFGQNGNSTAMVIQALSALGLDFSTADSPFSRDGVTPLDALLAYQGESGAFQADFGDGPFDDFFTTVQAVQAVALAAETPVPTLISEPIQDASALSAVNWLIANHQNADGGYSSFSGGADLAPSDIGGTLDALLAISKAGVAPDDSLAYLTENIADVVAYASGDGGSAGKLVWALIEAGQDPRNFGGEDFVATLKNQLQEDGSYNVFHPFAQSLAIYGLAFAGEPVPEEAIAWLTAMQATEEGLDGSWDDGFGTLGNADATAMAILALTAAGVPSDDSSLSRAVDFLTAVQLETGGWEYATGFGQNGNSTAMVVQALDALGLDIASADSAYARNGATPLDALLSYQSETGAFQTDFGDGPFDDFFTTVQAVPAVALAGAPVPVLIAEPVEEPTAEPAEEPTAVPVEEPTAEPVEEPTEVPPTAVPEPTEAPVVEEPAEATPEHSAAPIETAEPPGSAAPIILVVIALTLAGGAYWYLKNK